MTRRVVVLTGAGVSAESGLGTFRDADGLWAKFNPMELATPEAFARDPAKVQHFYNLRRRNLLDAEPNAAHAALARLEAWLDANGGRLDIVTQNVDDLHEKAGSANVTHMHGELLKSRCIACGDVAAVAVDLNDTSACAACGAAGRLRPHIVWFGEMPFHMPEIGALLAAAELFVSIGTSGTVYPAAGFVAEARAFGVPTLELNLEPSDGASLFDDARYGPAGEVVSAWVEELIAEADA